MPKVKYAASEGQRFAGDATLAVVVCPTCHITYAHPESLNQSLLAYRGDQSNGWKTNCPMGHDWWYTTPSETKEQRLERQLQAARADAGRMAAQRDQARASVRAQKAAATRARNQRDRLRARIAEGVCPCCNRTFKGLKSHMRIKHPEWVEEHGATAFAQEHQAAE